MKTTQVSETTNGSAIWKADLSEYGPDQRYVRTIHGMIAGDVIARGLDMEEFLNDIWEQTKHVGNLFITVMVSKDEGVEIEASSDGTGIDLHGFFPLGEDFPDFISWQFAEC